MRTPAKPKAKRPHAKPPAHEKSRIVCFWIEPADTAEESLRRYCPSERAKCPLSFGYHNASAVLGNVSWTGDTNGGGADDFPHDDPRWPKACECGYVFAADDEWQHNFDRFYRRTDNGARMLIRNAPPGAMWDAKWFDSWKGSDGRTLVVRLPDDHDWIIDAPASNSGTPWTRSGEPPKVTARPSILTPRYHGWLTDGVLISV